MDVQQAQRFGLTRAWFSQAELDVSRDRVVRAVLRGDQLFVLTTAGVLHSMDAETGQTDWVVRIGNPRHPSLGPTANESYVALVNGSTLFVLDRSSGLEVISRELGGGAGGGPALTETHAYVPMFSGRMEAHALHDPDEPTWYYASAGRIFDAATATPASIIWPTDRGFLYVANTDAGGVRYRFESTSPFAAEPAVAGGIIYAASAHGNIYALHEQSGAQRWRYVAGAPLLRSPVVIGDRVYAATEFPSLHCLATSGQFLWEAPDVQQLVGVSSTRVYGINLFGDITILDGASGVRQGQLLTSDATTAARNEETDRLYLVSETGLVQCLHEIGADEPLRHKTLPTPPALEADEPAADTPPAPQPDEEEMEPEESAERTPPAFENPFGGDDPFGAGENPFGPNPFGGEDEGNSGPAPARDNPFGF